MNIYKFFLYKYFRMVDYCRERRNMNRNKIFLDKIFLILLKYWGDNKRVIDLSSPPVKPVGTRWDPLGPVLTRWDPLGHVGTRCNPFGVLCTDLPSSGVVDYTTERRKTEREKRKMFTTQREEVLCEKII